MPSGVDARNPLADYFLTVLLARAGDWKGANAALENISPVLSRFPRGEYFQALVKINVDQTEQAIDAPIKYVARTPRTLPATSCWPAFTRGRAGPSRWSRC